MHLHLLLQLMGVGEQTKEKKDMPSSFKAVTQNVCALLSISNVPDCYFIKVKVKVKSFSRVRLFATCGL